MRTLFFGDDAIAGSGRGVVGHLAEATEVAGIDAVLFDLGVRGETSVATCATPFLHPGGPAGPESLAERVIEQGWLAWLSVPACAS